MDYILYNGNFISMEGETERYQAVAICGDKIACTYGAKDQFPKRCFGTKMIDLAGRTVLPGFIDSNIHMVQSGLLQYCVKINAETKDAFLQHLQEKALEFEDGELVWCIGYNEETIDVTRWDLDQVSSSHPIVVSRTEFHKTVVNTTAYNMLQIPSSLSGVIRDENDMPTGVLRGEASGFARRKLYTNFVSDDLRRKAVRDMEREAFRYGITTVNAMEGGAFFSGRDIDIVNAYAKDSALNILLFPQTMDVTRIKEMGLSRIGGNIYLDGSIGSKNAALMTNYRGCEHNGTLYYSQDDVNQFVLEAHAQGMQIALSCIGPRAIDQALTAFSSAFEAVGSGNHRHRMELFVLPDAEQIEKAIALGLILSMRPNYDDLWGGSQGMYAANMGSGWEACNPVGQVVRRGGIVCGGSEYSVTPLNPLISIRSCLLHSQEEQRISLYEALKTYTVNGAYANFAEDSIGQIRAGMQADLVVLDEDPFAVREQSLGDIGITMTMKSGRIVYSKGEAEWK